jgi:hypothetical protein
MKQFDSIYGEYSPPEWIAPLIQTPVVQRLRWVALSNIPSLSYPMISGVSRYAHSMGVSYLGGVLAHQQGLDKDEHKTLACAGLLHDAGMPPLGHITEEALRSVGIVYDHEDSLRSIIFVEGQRFHLMPDGEKVGLTEAFQKIGADSEGIFNTIIGSGKLGKYMASSMDIDNIDNVIRLYRLIFPGDKGYNPKDIVKGYFSEGTDNEKHKLIWDGVRKALYTKLMFSIEDFRQKATIKRIIKTYFKRQIAKIGKIELVNSIQFLNDSEFMKKILDDLKGTDHQCNFYSGHFDSLISYGWVEQISSTDLLKAKDVLSGDGYYFDYIPDKRFKSKDKSKERGALVGVFSYGKSKRPMNDGELKMLMFNTLPGFQESHSPEGGSENQQLLFI